MKRKIFTLISIAAISLFLTFEGCGGGGGGGGGDGDSGEGDTGISYTGITSSVRLTFE